MSFSDLGSGGTVHASAVASWIAVDVLGSEVGGKMKTISVLVWCCRGLMRHLCRHFSDREPQGSFVLCYPQMGLQVDRLAD